MAFEIGGGITIGGGVTIEVPSTPVWTPKTVALVNYSTQINSNNPFYTFSTDGLKQLKLAASYNGSSYDIVIQYLALTSAWDVTSLQSQPPPSGQIVNVTTSPYGDPTILSDEIRYYLAWNPNGLVANFMVQGTQANTVKFGKFTFSSAFNPASLTSTTVGDDVTTTVAGLTGTGLTFNSDGTKAYSCAGSSIYEWDVPTAYDCTSITTNNGNSFNVNGNIPGAGNPQQVAFTPSGNGLYIVTLGPTFGGVVYQLELSTPWDISTVDINTLDTTDLGSGGLNAGIGYMSIQGCVVSTDGTKLYVPAFESGSFSERCFEFSLT